MRWRRLVPVVFMGSLAVAYVLARPSLLGRVPHLAIFEFPAGAAIVAFLMWAAFARIKPRTPPAPWRRHQQVVREIPDPALARDVAAIERWLESGHDAEAAADVIARARTTDAREQARLRASVAKELAGHHLTRRKRESILKHHTEGV